MTTRKFKAQLITACAAAALLSGCSSAAYYWQSVNGHIDIMRSARPVTQLIADAQTPEPLKTRLALSQRIRSFAVTALKLPDNASYRGYADLHRGAAVWNVVAAPEFSLTLNTWCFPVVGCVGYRGYFNEVAARLEAQSLQEQGLEVSVYGVPAYSTLGWLNWAGGDPLLNTFINYPEGELARLIFHELSHQVAYASGDTVFNESFATAVERLGSQRWLETQASEAARQQYAVFNQRRQDFRALALTTRQELAAVYAENDALVTEFTTQHAIKSIVSSSLSSSSITSEREKAQAKALVMQGFHHRYAQLKLSWGGFSGYDPWVAKANNASFGAQAAYDELVPDFEALFERENRDWQRFFDAVKKLTDLPKAARRQALKTRQ